MVRWPLVHTCSRGRSTSGGDAFALDPDARRGGGQDPTHPTERKLALTDGYTGPARVYACLVLSLAAAALLYGRTGHDLAPALLGALALCLLPLAPVAWAGRTGILPWENQRRWEFFLTRPAWWRLGLVAVGVVSLGAILSLGRAPRGVYVPGSRTAWLGAVVALMSWIALDAVNLAAERARASANERPGQRVR